MNALRVHRIARPTRRMTAILLVGMGLGLGVNRAIADSNYELAVAAKQTEIKWKQSDLLGAQRELAILNGFLGGYEEKAANLANARQQLANADGQLATIQQGNLVKLTIRMGIETYSTISDTISVGKTAATALITHGVTTAVGGVALDKLKSGLGNQAKAAIGMDDESLTSPRTVRIKAVSDSARAAFPDLARVQQTMALSLEGVKAAAYHEDGTELGDTGAILRKNIMVRDEIATAITKLDALATQSAEARSESEIRLPEVQADVDRLTAELGALNVELANLTTAWKDAEAAARAAENAAAVVAPVVPPVPSVTVGREENEDDFSYAARVRAAVVAAAMARWSAEAGPVLAEIATTKNGIASLQTEITTGVAAAVETPWVGSFIHTYGGSDAVDANETASYHSAISGYDALGEWIALVEPSQAALPGLITQAEDLADRYTLLANQQNQVTGVRQMLAAAGAATPGEYYTAMEVPGMGQVGAEDLAVQLDQVLSMLPAALQNARARHDKLSAAVNAWSAGIGGVSDDIDTHLAAAESALAELIARGRAWSNALEAATGMTTDAVTGDQYCRLGYYSGATYVPVVRHGFSMGLYKSSVLAALATPGTGGLSQAVDLRGRFDALNASAPALKDAYDASWQRYKAAFAHVKSYSSQWLGFPVLDDWSQAGAYSSTQHPVDTSGIADQAARFQSLHYTNEQHHITSLTGGEPVVGQQVLQWVGLPRLRQLPDPGLDDDHAFPPHRLMEVKRAVVVNGPGWISLPPEGFSAKYNEQFDELSIILQEAQQTYDSPLESTVMSLYAELGALNNTYIAAHPPAQISTHPADSYHQIQPGGTAVATLSVEASGDFLTYKWFTTAWPEFEWTWAEVPGATSSSYTTPGLTATTHYRVQITNPGGTTVSKSARVMVNVIYPPPVFTSPDHASAQVGVPFSWTFTTDVTAWISPQGAIIPPGLQFMFMLGTISGTPTEAGTYDIMVSAFSNGSVGIQNFRLVVAPGTTTPLDNWTQQWTTAEQRANPAFTTFHGAPAGDGVCNALKYAFNLMGTDPGQVTSLATPCLSRLAPDGRAGLPRMEINPAGRLTLLYVRRKASSQPAVAYAVEFAAGLGAGAWSVNGDATEQVTSLDDTWERVLVTDSAPATGVRFARVRVALK